MTIFYDITATVRLDLCETYELYMRERHIPDVLRTGAFCEATISTVDRGLYRVCYQADSRDSLDSYLKNHAACLRKDFQEHFPEGVELSRKEWTVIETWKC